MRTLHSFTALPRWLRLAWALALAAGLLLQGGVLRTAPAAAAPDAHQHLVAQVADPAKLHARVDAADAHAECAGGEHAAGAKGPQHSCSLGCALCAVLPVSQVPMPVAQAAAAPAPLPPCGHVGVAAPPETPPPIA